VTTDLQNLTHLQSLKLAHTISSMEKLDILIKVDHYWEIVGNCGKIQGKGKRSHSHAIKIGVSVVRAISATGI